MTLHRHPSEKMCLCFCAEILKRSFHFQATLVFFRDLFLGNRNAWLDSQLDENYYIFQSEVYLVFLCAL